MPRSDLRDRAPAEFGLDELGILLLLDHPGVVEVAVLGVPDAQWGENGAIAVMRG